MDMSRRIVPALSLESLPRRQSGVVASIDWSRLADPEARRLRELGFDEGVAVEVLHRRELAAETDPQRRADLVARLAASHTARTGGLARAMDCGAVDEVVEPRHTRAVLVRALAQLPPRRGDRANPPL